MTIVDFGAPSPSRDRDGIGRRDLLGIHCCPGSISEEQPVDPWAWKTGLGQGFWILEFRIWIELILDFGLRPSEIRPPCGILRRRFRRAEFHRAGIAETMRCWVERKGEGLAAKCDGNL